MITIDHVEIVRIKKANVAGVGSDLVAVFDAIVGPFRLRNGQIRRRHADGELFAQTPGRGSGSNADSAGINMRHCPEREWVCAKVLEAYRNV
ncbi:MAG: hypothetical protein M9895_05055 [Aquamicrobium sp.]|uniref:hypothetical protein n=1 Tax=Aquamicrobium sp. TaxID=1872579 RepID=UPI00349E6C50|nr:hypothetical protein [Aquamicrobium sp.]MCO5158959.1 hypothetical protein [Aquamicrobium sp.]